jgi:hypothetical protein
MRLALRYPGSISTSFGGFVESARTPTDNSLQAPKVGGEINGNGNPREHSNQGVLVRGSSPQP